MTNRLRIALAFLVLAAGVARALIFEPPYDGLRVKVQRFETAGFPRVDLFFRIESGHKQDFRYLDPANIRLIEEEVEIKDFSVELEEPPLSVALVLDDSGSIDPELEYLKEAATRFVEELHRLDEVAVVSFHRKAQVLQERTQARQRVKEAIGKLRAYGATAVYDGAMLGFDAVREGRGERKMLLLTDGNDQVYVGGRALSLTNMNEIVARARAEGVEVYTIGLGQHADMEMLRELARKTGGQAWYAPKPRHLRPVFDAIARSMTATYRIRYVSPNARREKQDRTVTVDVNYQGHLGRGVGTYWLDKEIPVAPVTVERQRVAGDGPGKLRLFTSGLRGEFLQVDFTLRRMAEGKTRGEIVRAGRTTVDGFGRLDRPDPLLVGIRPGKYELELKIPDQDVRFRLPGIEVVGGETTSRVVHFSRLVFFRDGDPWYDLPHPYGPTSELLKVRISDALAHVFEGQGEGVGSLFEGRLAQLKHHREVAVWLPEGIYDIALENLWSDEDPAVDQGEAAPLVNALKSRLQVLGGRELRFEIRREDLAGEEDVLSPEYLAANPDESPFLRDRPETERELDAAITRRRSRYLQGRFTRHDAETEGWKQLYTYRNPAEVQARLAELTNRYDGPEPAPEALPVDESYLDDHHLGAQTRKKRLEEIAGHYLTEANPSFPDHALASDRYPGGPGDRYEGVGEIRKRHDGLDREVTATGRTKSKQELLWDLREKVAYSRPPAEAPGDAQPVVDPSDPGRLSTVGELADRIRGKIRQEYYQHPEAGELHNLDSKR